MGPLALFTWLTPIDFSFIPKLKNVLKEQGFLDIPDIECNVTILGGILKNDFQDYCRQWHRRLTKHIASSGEYFKGKFWELNCLTTYCSRPFFYFLLLSFNFVIFYPIIQCCIISVTESAKKNKEMPLPVILYVVLIIMTYQSYEIYEMICFVISDTWLPSFGFFSLSMLLVVVVWHCRNNIDKLYI
jgi:hypothetical protein